MNARKRWSNGAAWNVASICRLHHGGWWRTLKSTAPKPTPIKKCKRRTRRCAGRVPKMKAFIIGVVWRQVARPSQYKPTRTWIKKLIKMEHTKTDSRGAEASDVTRDWCRAQTLFWQKCINGGVAAAICCAETTDRRYICAAVAARRKIICPNFHLTVAGNWSTSDGVLTSAALALGAFTWI